MRPLDRRTLLKGAGAGAALALLPFRIPLATATTLHVRTRTIRRYRKVHRLLRRLEANPSFQQLVLTNTRGIDLQALHATLHRPPTIGPIGVTSRARRHVRVGLERAAHLRAFYRTLTEREASPLEVGLGIVALADRSPARLAQGAASGVISRAWAQAPPLVEPIPLEPIYVVAPPMSFYEYTNFAYVAPNQSSYPSLLAYNSYINYYLPMQRAMEAARQAEIEQQHAIWLAQQQQAPPPPPEVPIESPPPVYTNREEDFLFDGAGPDVQQRLEAIGLSEAVALTAVATLAAVPAIVEAAKPFGLTAGQLIREGMASGELQIAITSVGAGIMLSITWAAMIAVGIVLVGLVIYNVYPAIDQRITLFGTTLFQTEVTLDAAPQATEPEAQIEPEAPDEEE